MEIPCDSFVGLKSLPVLSGRDVPYVTARMLLSPFPFLTYFTFLSVHLWVSQLSVFLSNITLIFKNLQKSRKCKNMNSTERKGIDASVSKVSWPISKNTLLDFILWKKLWPSAQIRTQISWYLHCWNSTKLTMWNIQLQHFCSGAQEPVGTTAKIPSLQKLSGFDTEKLFPWNPSLKQGWVLNMKG